MTDISIIIAETCITFRTNHQADRDCIEEVFFYHINKNKQIPDINSCHDVIIASTNEKFQLPDMPLVWTGYLNKNIPVCWYNPIGQHENVITIANDIIIRHLPDKKLTICHLTETKAHFFKSHRPLLTNYLFFLLHSILSMYGKYCIHASCASIGGLAYLFIGKAGEGKSTMSIILGKAGYEYMGDDLVFISQNESGEIVIDSFLSKIKLLKPDSDEKDSIDAIKDKNFKYSYRRKLGAIINLQRTNVGKKSILTTATQLESFGWLINSGNNIKIQYNKQLLMNVCEQASILPSYTLMFADKEHFEPGIIETILIQ